MINNFKKATASILVKCLIAGIAITSVGIYPAEGSFGVNVSVKQVKTPNSHTIYYLDHARGLRKSYVSEKAFLSYGNEWSDVVTINESVLAKWPDARLIKTADSAAVYYINNGQKCAIKSAEEFYANDFSWSEIMTVNKTDFNEYKTVSDCKDIMEKYSAANESNSERVNVSLADSNPKAGYLPYGTRGNIIAVFNLESSGGTTVVSSISVDLKGVYSFDELDKITLADADGVEYDVIQSRIDNRTVTFIFNTPLSVDSSGRKVAVMIDLNNVSAGSYHSIQASLAAYSYIKTSSYVSGNWPITANEFKFIDGGNVLAMAKVKEYSVIASGGKTEAVVGATEKVIGKWKVSETSGREDLILNKLSFINKGSSIYSDLGNFKLKNGSKTIAQVKSIGRDNIVTFNINGFKIAKGASAEFVMTADILAGDGRTIDYNYYDIEVIDNDLRFRLSADSESLSEQIAIKREAVGVSARDLKAGSKTFTNESGVLIGNFQIKNGNRKVDFDQLAFSLKKNSSAPALNDTVWVVNYDTGTVLGYVNGGNFNENGSSIYLHGFSLKNQENMNLAFITNIPDKAKTGDNYRITLNSISYFTDNNLYFTDSVNVAGNTFVVTKSSLFVYANNSWTSTAYTKGQKGIKIASFNAEAAAGDDVIIESITLSDGSETSAHITYENGFSNLKLYASWNQSSTVISVPEGGSFTFEGLNARVSAGNRAEIKVYADTESDLKVNEAQLQIVKIVARSASSNIPTTISNVNVNSAKATFGDVSAKITAISGGTASINTKGNLVSSLKVENTGAEKLYLKSVVMETDGDGFTSSLGYSNLKVVNRASNSTLGSIYSPVAGANTLSLGTYLDAGSSITLDFYVDAGNIGSADYNIDFRDLKAKGKTSDIYAVVDGDPTDTVKFTSSGTGSTAAAGGGVAIASTANSSASSASVSSTSGLLYWPTDSRKINYYFHDPNYPYKDTLGDHTGIDIAVSQGSNVKAAKAGTVIDLASNTTSDLNYVTIDHGDGLMTYYAHLSSVKVTVGQKVTAGQLIGLSGGTPGTAGAGEYTTGAHLHFEVVVNGIEVDPMNYLK